ncbi:hypothetical protein ES705_33198 [subsurface metagenome]
MELQFLIKGFIVGLVVSIPLGPMGVLCIQRTLNKGKSSGFSSGMGIATADAIFALIAGLGISFIINFLSEQQLIIKIIGGMIIAFIGLRIFIANPVKQLKKHRREGKNLFEDFISILFMGLSNPFTIFLYIAIFAVMLFNTLIKYTSAIFGASVTYFIPIIAIMWGILDGEPFTFNHLLWFMVIIVGVYLVNKQKLIKTHL